MKVNPVLQYVKEVLETTDTKKVAQLLSTGEWIAISAIENEPIQMCIRDRSQSYAAECFQMGTG